MGACNSNENNLVINEKEEREEMLQSVLKEIKRLESLIENLNKRDIKYKMSQLLFLMDIIKEIQPVVKFIENNINYKFSSIKIIFIELLNAVESLNQQESYKLIKDLHKSLNIENNDMKKGIGRLSVNSSNL